MRVASAGPGSATSAAGPWRGLRKLGRRRGSPWPDHLGGAAEVKPAHSRGPRRGASPVTAAAGAAGKTPREIGLALAAGGAAFGSPPAIRRERRLPHQPSQSAKVPRHRRLILGEIRVRLQPLPPRVTTTSLAPVSATLRGRGVFLAVITPRPQRNLHDVGHGDHRVRRPCAFSGP
jgi:hypothetical protein